MLSLGSKATIHIVQEVQDFYMHNPRYIYRLSRTYTDIHILIHIHVCIYSYIEIHTIKILRYITAVFKSDFLETQVSYILFPGYE